MCNVVPLMIASTAVQTLGQIQQGRAAAADAKFQQRIAMDNAGRTEQRIRDANFRGTDREQQILAEGGRTIARTRGAMGANNMDLTFGSPLDTIIQSSVEVQRDALRERLNTAKEIDDLRVQRTNYENAASARGAEATNARRGAFVAGVGTALGGYAGVERYRAGVSIS